MDTPKKKEYHVYVRESDITATAIAEAENQRILAELENE